MTVERKFASAGELVEPIGYGLSNPDRLEWLRTEERTPYRIDLWDTQEIDSETGKSILAYRLCLYHQQGEVWEIVFAGEDFKPGLHTPIDSDQALADLLGFFSCKPGDTEAEFFANYTLAQLAFAKQHGEELNIWSQDLEGGENGSA